MSLCQGHIQCVSEERRERRGEEEGKKQSTNVPHCFFHHCFARVLAAQSLSWFEAINASADNNSSNHNSNHNSNSSTNSFEFTEVLGLGVRLSSLRVVSTENTLHVFGFGENDRKLYHITRDHIKKTSAQYTVALPVAAKSPVLEIYRAYVTELTVLNDALGVPHGCAQFTLWTDNTTAMKINGEFHLLEKGEKHQCVTDAAGKVLYVLFVTSCELVPLLHRRVGWLLMWR